MNVEQVREEVKSVLDKFITYNDLTDDTDKTSYAN